MLDGYKTYVGGIGAILSGIGYVLWNAYEGNPIDWNIAGGWIIAGWTIIGGRSAYAKK